VCLTLLIGVAAAISTVPARAAINGDNGYIAFDLRNRGDTDLYLVPPNGGVPYRLPASLSGASDSRPSWAPGGPIVSAEVIEQPPTPPQRLRLTYHPGPRRALRGVTIDGVAAAATDDPTAGIVATIPAGVTVTDTTPICLTLSAGLAYAPGLTQTMVATGSDGGGGTADPRQLCHNTQPIAFQSDRLHHDYDIWIYDSVAPLGDANPVDVTPWIGSNETGPAWSSTSVQDFGSDYDAPLLATREATATSTCSTRRGRPSRA
jgi:hypothetical protein